MATDIPCVVSSLTNGHRDAKTKRERSTVTNSISRRAHLLYGLSAAGCIRHGQSHRELMVITITITYYFITSSVSKVNLWVITYLLDQCEQSAVNKLVRVRLSLSYSWKLRR